MTVPGPDPIGLRQGTVLVIEHQRGWAELYESQRRLLHERIGHLVLDIQHVGSTAIPGLSAKPIIDIAAALPPAADVAAIRASLCELGYIDRGDAGGDGGHLFVRDRTPGVRTHHLHLVGADDPQWRNYVRFRDRLRSDPRACAEYGSLKASLSRQFANDRRAYTAAKVEFIRSILASG